MGEIKTLSDLARLVQKNMEEFRAHKQDPEPPPEPEPEKKEPEEPKTEPPEQDRKATTYRMFLRDQSAPTAVMKIGGLKCRIFH